MQSSSLKSAAFSVMQNTALSWVLVELIKTVNLILSLFKHMLHEDFNL